MRFFFVQSDLEDAGGYRVVIGAASLALGDCAVGVFVFVFKDIEGLWGYGVCDALWWLFTEF